MTLFVFLARLDGGVMYIRWGRLVCPGGATALYQGFAAGTYYSHTAGISSLFCLPNTPTYVETEVGGLYSTLHSTEYDTQNYVFDIATQDYNVPCVACHVPRTSTVMIPGTSTQLS